MNNNENQTPVIEKGYTPGFKLKSQDPIQKDTTESGLLSNRIQQLLNKRYYKTDIKVTVGVAISSLLTKGVRIVAKYSIPEDGLSYEHPLTHEYYTEKIKTPNVDGCSIAVELMSRQASANIQKNISMVRKSLRKKLKSMEGV